MDETKLTVRISRETLEAAKRHATEHGTTLTRLIVNYLENVRRQDDALADAPLTRRLTGSLSREASIQEYREHLERKYG